MASRGDRRLSYLGVPRRQNESQEFQRIRAESTEGGKNPFSFIAPSIQGLIVPQLGDFTSEKAIAPPLG
jgi:hypothetical protein